MYKRQAVYLTEYASNRRLIEVTEFTNETLAGIPSIIYGLVGMLVFSQALGFQTCLLYTSWRAQQLRLQQSLCPACWSAAAVEVLRPMR